MFELFELIKIKNEHSYKGLDGETIVIPKGTEAYIVEKHNDCYTVEFIDHDKIIPPVGDFLEDEIERA